MPRRGEQQSGSEVEIDPTQVVETTILVRYAETDQMGVVYYANYLIWFEVARGAFCRARGIDYSQMERDGVGLPLLEAHCRYIRPARYDEEITIRTWIAETRRSLLKMRYEVKRGDTLLATGETLQMLIELSTGKPRRLPPEFSGLLQENGSKQEGRNE